MIRIEPHVLEIVVLAPGADAFLGVRRARVAPRNGPGPFADICLFLTEEDGHELVHPCVGEEQVGRIRHQTRRRHNGVVLRFEEVQERLTYFSTGHTKRLNSPQKPGNLPSGRTKKISTTAPLRREKNMFASTSEPI